MDRLFSVLSHLAPHRPVFAGTGSFFSHPKEDTFAVKKCIMQKAAVEIEDCMLSIANEEYSIGQEMIPGLVFKVTPALELSVCAVEEEDTVFSVRFRRLQHEELLGTVPWLSVEFCTDAEAAQFLSAIVLVLSGHKRGKRLTEAECRQFVMCQQERKRTERLTREEKALLVRTTPMQQLARREAAHKAGKDSREEKKTHADRHENVSESDPRRPVPETFELIDGLPGEIRTENILFIGKGESDQGVEGKFLLVKLPSPMALLINQKHTLEILVEITPSLRYEFDLTSDTFQWQVGESWHSFHFHSSASALPPLLHALFRCAPADSAESKREKCQEVASAPVPRPRKPRKQKGIPQWVCANSRELPDETIESVYWSENAQRKLFVLTGNCMKILSVPELSVEKSICTDLTQAVVLSNCSCGDVLLYSSGQTAISVYSYERNAIVETWEVPYALVSIVEMPDTSLVCIGQAAVWRLQGEELLKERAFSSLAEFTSVCSNNLGFAIGNKKGEVRLYSDIGNALNKTESVGSRVTALDSTTDTHWLLATCSDSITLFETIIEGKSAFVQRRSVATRGVIRKDSGLKGNFLPARVDDKQSPVRVVSGAGSSVLLWDFQALAAGTIAEGSVVRNRQVCRTADAIVAAGFLAGDVVVAERRKVSVFVWSGDKV